MAKKNTSFAVSEEAAQFIDEQVKSGRYGSASEVMRAGLRLLETEDRKLRTLEKLLQDGRDSGPAETLDLDVFLEEMHDKYPDPHA